MDIILALAIILELFLVVLGFFSFFRKKYLSAGESYCYAVILMFIVFSVFIQGFFLLGIQSYFYWFEAGLLIFSLISLYKNKEDFFCIGKKLFILVRSNKILSFLVIFIFSYLFSQVVLLPPYNWDSMTYNLARVLMMQEAGSLFLENYTQVHQAMFPWGWDVLPFLFLRFYIDFGLPIFSFLSYTVIVVGTATLVNKLFKDPSLALSSAFVIASLKLLILQATTTKNDIATSAIAIVCFLAGYGFFISQGRIYLFMLLSSVLFGFTVKTYFPGFSIPFLLFLAIILLRAYPIKKIVAPFKGLLENRVLLIIPAGLFICIGLNWINNYLTFGNIQGEIDLIQKHANKDFLVGTLANAFRYSLQLLDLPSNYYNDIVVKFHDQIMGEFKNISLLRPYPFYLHNNFPPDENCSWYGPLAISLIVPSLVYAAVKGKGYLRVICFSLLSFFLVACYSMVWMRGSSRYFCIFFACSGVPLAFFLKNIIITKNLRIFILIVSLATFLYTMMFNDYKPFFSGNAVSFAQQTMKSGLPFLRNTLFVPRKRMLFKWMDYVTDRNAYYDTYFSSNDVLTVFTNKIKPGKRLLITGPETTWVFPFLIRRPDLRVTVARPNHIQLGDKTYDIYIEEDYNDLKSIFDYILFYDLDFPEDLMPGKILYFSNPRNYLSVTSISIYECHKDSQK